MRIGVDSREIQNGVITGIGRSLYHFIDYFSKNEFKHQLVLFSEKKLALNFNNNIENIVIAKCPTFIWDQVKLPLALNRHQINLFYSPYYKIPLLSRVPTVSQILDLMFLIHPFYKNNLTVIEKVYYSFFGRAFAKKAFRIITDSEHAKNDIVRLWNIDPLKIVVIPLGTADRYRPVTDKELLNQVRKRLKLPDKYLLYFGNFKPHKNVDFLLKAYGRLPQEIRRQYKLVLAGRKDAHCIELEKRAGQLKIENNVIFTGFIFEDDLPTLYSAASLFIFPSLYEGFGLPPLEAMACGTPVIASNTTSLPEVVGDAGILVDPHNVNDLNKAILKILSDKGLKTKLRQKGLSRVKQFSIHRTASDILNLLNLAAV
jgi:glycosyltransferase involved in cell wall biosynthesis